MYVKCAGVENFDNENLSRWDDRIPSSERPGGSSDQTLSKGNSDESKRLNI